MKHNDVEWQTQWPLRHAPLPLPLHRARGVYRPQRRVQKPGYRGEPAHWPDEWHPGSLQGLDPEIPSTSAPAPDSSGCIQPDRVPHKVKHGCDGDRAGRERSLPHHSEWRLTNRRCRSWSSTAHGAPGGEGRYPVPLQPD